MKYFTADLHIDHEKAMGFPGRKGISLQDWQSLILDEINGKVERSAHLYILGDFAFKPEQWRHKIKCKNVILIKGNHDPSNSRCRKVFGENSVYDTMCLKVKGHDTFLSHYPHLVWPSSHYGSFHLYGHVHNSRTSFWNDIPELKDRRSLDVCPESAKSFLGKFTIFNEDEIFSILSVRKGHDDVSWYRSRDGVL